MTFEPTEIEEIQMPILADLRINFDYIDALIHKQKIEEVLNIVDEAL